MSETKELLQAVVVEPISPATASIIWLHGLGADGHDFESIVQSLDLRDLNLRFIFPHAPFRQISINAGMKMRAWYDIYTLERMDLEDEAGIKESAQGIDALIQAELDAEIPSERIILAGFSQGGAMALYCGLRYSKPLAGILALSAYLPLLSKLKVEANNANRNTPLMVAHGSWDPVVPIAFGQMSVAALEKLGYAVDWRTYLMQHEVCQKEIHDIAVWLRKSLNHPG
jgi:phospholipase/carboxylesterase